MTQLTQSQQHSHTTPSHLVQKPHQPAKGFFTKAWLVKTKAGSPKQATQAPLTLCFEQAKQELQNISKQARTHVSHTPSEQMVFTQSSADLVEQLEALYAQAIGQHPLQPKPELQRRYAQTIALLPLFYGQAQPPPEALAQMKRLFYQIYVQAQKRQPPAVISPGSPREEQHAARSQAPTPPATQTQRMPMTPVSHSPTTPVQTAPPSLDESNCRPWTPAELQQLQQARQAQAQTPPPIKLQGSLPPQSLPANDARPPLLPPGQAANQRPLAPPQANQADLGNVQMGTGLPATPRVPRDRQSWDPRMSRREYLLRERTVLEREVQRVLGNASALNQRWQFWSTQKGQLEQDRRMVPAKEALSFVAHRLIRHPFPSAARNLAYRESRLRQEEAWLHQQAIAINAHYATLLEEIKVIDTEMDLLHF